MPATPIVTSLELTGALLTQPATDTTPDTWTLTFKPVGIANTVAPKAIPLLLLTTDPTVVSQMIPGHVYTLTLAP
jgi:hypothetical protein